MKGAPGRAWVVVPRAGVLVDAVHGLLGLVRIPGEPRHADVPAHGRGPRRGALVLVRLQRDVDASVRIADVAGQDALVVRAGLAAVIEGDRHGATWAGCNRRLELVGR